MLDVVDLPTHLRPWAVALGVVVAVFAVAIGVRALVPVSVTDPLGTGLLVVATAIAAATALGLLVQQRAVSRGVVFSLFLVFLFLSLLIR